MTTEVTLIRMIYTEKTPVQLKVPLYQDQEGDQTYVFGGRKIQMSIT